MKSVNDHVKYRINSTLRFIWILTLSIIIFGCQKNSPLSPKDNIGLAKEMKSWFETIDFKASGYSSMEEALEKIYQDNGYTVSLYRELEALLDQTNTSRVTYDSTLQKCQEWFEMIDYEASGYKSLEEAIKDIYQDDGSTLDLYRGLIKWNTSSG